MQTGHADSQLGASATLEPGRVTTLSADPSPDAQARLEARVPGSEEPAIFPLTRGSTRVQVEQVAPGQNTAGANRVKIRERP
jgi:hypothetical protein